MRARWLLLPLLAAFACRERSPSPGPPRDVPSPPLAGGTETNEHLAVGFIQLPPGWICTATLIHPRVAVTAAHCMSFETHAADGDHGTFVVESSPGVHLHAAHVTRVHSFGAQVGERDVAVLLLDAPIPDDVVPLPLAPAYPADGTTFTQLGYGCQVRPKCGDPKPFVLGRKQIVTGTLGSQAVSCAGDSGGPLLVDDALFGVSSGAWCDDQPDISGKVADMRAEIAMVLDNWGVCAGAAAGVGACVQPEPACEDSEGRFTWSCHRRLPDQQCIRIREPKDPDTWNDNFLCARQSQGVTWSSTGARRDMHCERIAESAEPAAHGWGDNHLCVPLDSQIRLHWSSAGRIPGLRCVRWHEPSDAHTWDDNWLCWGPAPPPVDEEACREACTVELDACKAQCRVEGHRGCEGQCLADAARCRGECKPR